MKYAIHMRRETDGHDWVLLADGAWAAPGSCHETAKPPYFHVAKLFKTMKEARLFVLNSRRNDIRVVPWRAPSRENAES